MTYSCAGKYSLKNHEFKHSYCERGQCVTNKSSVTLTDIRTALKLVCKAGESIIFAAELKDEPLHKADL